MSIICGAGPSWRLGRSLGTDSIPAEGKTRTLARTFARTFDCVYCQSGRTAWFIVERQIFVGTERLI